MDPRDDATHVQSTIALYTELHAAVYRTCRSLHICRRPVIAGCCQHRTARCRCLYRTRR